MKLSGINIPISNKSKEKNTKEKVTASRDFIDFISFKGQVAIPQE